MRPSHHRIDADPVQVGTFLKSRSHLQVPIYQRNFAWTTSNVDQLWEDLLSTIDGQDESYFLGSMVFVEKDDSTLEVVDGQQRLACLSLLLAVIRDVLKENGGQHASNLETTYLLARSIRGEAAPKLSLNERDNATFRELVEGTILLADIEARSKSREVLESHKLLYSAYVQLRSKVRDYTNAFENTDRLFKIAETVDARIWVIVINTFSEESAYMLFETLNDRGVDLTLADLLKNYLFSRSGTRLSDVQTRWNDLVATVGQDSMTQFLRHEYMSQEGKIRERDLYVKLKRAITDSQAVMAYSKRILDAAAIYGHIRNPMSDFWSDFPKPVETRKLLTTINLLQVSQCYPLLFAAVDVRKGDFWRICEWIVALSVRYSVIGGRGTGNLETVYARAALAARDRDQEVHRIKTILKELDIKDEEVELAFATKTVTEPRIIKYILSELEMALRGASELMPGTDLTVEHVLPKKLTSDWKQDFSEEKHRELVSYVGNLTLLTGAVNTSISNGPYSAKRDIYRASELKITQMIGEEDAWNPQKIEDRQLKLGELAKVRWRLQN